MSYATLHHDNRSRHTVGQVEGFYSTSLQSSSSSDDDSATDMNEQGGLDENFELGDLTRSHSGSGYLGTTLGPETGESHSDEEEKSPTFLRSRKASALTLQSFMLYTPDEERSVIKKFDRRLVLFVALLYMLSFLDRSSTFLHPIDCSMLTIIRYRKCEDCGFVERFTSKLIAI